MKPKLLFILMVFMLNIVVLLANGIEDILGGLLDEKEIITWEANFKYKNYIPLNIEGLPRLLIVIYQRERQGGGNLVDFVLVDKENQRVKYIFKKAGERKGVAPIFDGYDVFPNGSQAEIILRWHYDGTGQYRMVQKFIFDGNNIKLLDQADFSGYPDKIWRKSDDE